jgi:hypothetical protein
MWQLGYDPSLDLPSKNWASPGRHRAGVDSARSCTAVQGRCPDQENFPPKESEGKFAGPSGRHSLQHARAEFRPHLRGVGSHTGAILKMPDRPDNPQQIDAEPHGSHEYGLATVESPLIPLSYGIHAHSTR